MTFEEKIEYSEILNRLPASVHIIEIDKNGFSKLCWANENYFKEVGLTIQERQEIGFLDPKNYYHPDDVNDILTLTSHLWEKKKSEASFFCRTIIHQNEGWIYIKMKRIPIESEKVHVLCLAFGLQDKNELKRLKFDSYVQEINRLKNQVRLNDLTKTERIVLSLLGKGLSTKEVASSLCRSFDTVNNHKRSIFRKLNFHKLSELVAFANECGLVNE